MINVNDDVKQHLLDQRDEKNCKPDLIRKIINSSSLRTMHQSTKVFSIRTVEEFEVEER